MKKPDKIKKGLWHCSEDGCKKCPYEDDCNMADGFSILAYDALTLIKQYESELINLQRLFAAAESRANLLEAERDAAIDDMTEIVQKYGESYCEYCGSGFKPECTGKCWTLNEGFKWRGVQKEE